MTGLRWIGTSFLDFFAVTVGGLEALGGAIRAIIKGIFTKATIREELDKVFTAVADRLERFYNEREKANRNWNKGFEDIAEDHAKRLVSIAEWEATQVGERQRKEADALEEIKKSVREARSEWEKAVAAAKAPEEVAKSPLPAKAPRRRQQLETLLGERTVVRGTFSPWAAARMPGMVPLQRIANATEETAENTEEIADNTKQLIELLPVFQ